MTDFPAAALSTNDGLYLFGKYTIGTESYLDQSCIGVAKQLEIVQHPFLSAGCESLQPRCLTPDCYCYCSECQLTSDFKSYVYRVTKEIYGIAHEIGSVSTTKIILLLKSGQVL